MSPSAVTSEETNAYRYGGDEFLMIIPDGTQEIAEDVIEKWRQVMKPIQKNSEIPVSASVGWVRDGDIQIFTYYIKV